MDLLAGADGKGKVWVLDTEAKGHLGCGESVDNPAGWWSANANEKAGTGLYDDAITFFPDGKYVYDSGEDGKMYIPDPAGGKKVVKKDGKLYFTIDGVNQTNGLNELDGEYYYANEDGTLVMNSTIRITEFNDLIAPGSGYFAFDAEGKLIKTGFVSGGGSTYYYDNLVRVKGFMKIDDDYYFFNARTGKMSVNANLWVGDNNPYGIPAGTYQFGPDGRMVR